MKNRSLLLLLAVLLCATVPGVDATAHSPLLASIQDSASTLLNQAAALQTAGHPAQAGALYLRVADAAVAAGYLDIASATYQKAADAFHLANNPGQEAIAYERQANVYLKQAGVTPPPAGTLTPKATSRPTPPPARQALPGAPAPVPVPKAVKGNPVSGGITLTRNAAIGAKFGAPGPRSCSSMNQPSRGPLSPEQARAYVICGYEQDYQGGQEELFLVGQVQVQVSRGRPYEQGPDTLDQIDPRRPVYDIRGTSVTYLCSLPSVISPTDRRCSRTVNANDKGLCYQTTFNEWRCTWGDLTAPMSTDPALNIPPPKPSDVE